VTKYSCTSHHLHREFRRENTGVLGLIFFENVRLHGATHGGQGFGLDTRVGFRVHHLIAGDAQQAKAQAGIGLR
jgi:hypothetical protein